MSLAAPAFEALDCCSASWLRRPFRCLSFGQGLLGPRRLVGVARLDDQRVPGKTFLTPSMAFHRMTSGRLTPCRLAILTKVSPASYT